MNRKDISDDEIQILGSAYRADGEKRISGTKRLLIWFLSAAAALTVAILMYLFTGQGNKKSAGESVSIQTNQTAKESHVSATEILPSGHIEVTEETVDDVALRIFIPRNALPELTLTRPEETDTSIVFATRAADVGGNNYGIVGDFVLAGERLARGVKKEGFCAIVNRTVTVGVDTETPLLEDAIREKGYFFRQYPLVKNAQAIDNEPKGKSIRRALAIRTGEILMVESIARESFHDFAQALADAGVTEAIYLVGGAAVHGWWRDEQGRQSFFGTKDETHPDGASYLVWKKMQ
jgi:hypothetical protein